MTLPLRLAGALCLCLSVIGLVGLQTGAKAMSFQADATQVLP